MKTEQAESLQWCDDLVDHLTASESLVVGLISGNREPNDARAIHRVSKRMADSLVRLPGHSGLIVCRLDIQSSLPKLPGFRRQVQDQFAQPNIAKSALGNWFEVQIQVLLGSTAPLALQQLPRLLAKWKQRYSLVIVDLGPIHLIPSRTLGRSCDVNYLLLGPNSCASTQWLLQYVDYHEYCGSRILGTVVTTIAA